MDEKILQRCLSSWDNGIFTLEPETVLKVLGYINTNPNSLSVNFLFGNSKRDPSPANKLNP